MIISIIVSVGSQQLDHQVSDDNVDVCGFSSMTRKNHVLVPSISSLFSKSMLDDLLHSNLDYGYYFFTFIFRIFRFFLRFLFLLF